MTLKHPAILIIFFTIALYSAASSASTFLDVQEYLEEGNYDQARKALQLVDQVGIPGEDALWQSKLAGSPSQALDVLSKGYNDQSFPLSSRIALGMEIARINSALGNHAEVLKVLRPLIDHPEATLPGDVFYMMGRSLRALGQLQKAREMLASVKPADEAFGRSRFLLGDIGLQQNDATLALHYFDAALGVDDNPNKALALAGRWKALRQLGQESEAGQLYSNLLKTHPGGLAILEIKGEIRGEEEELAARIASQPAPEILDEPTETSGHYCLQLGAFSDRSLALEMQRKYIDRLPELRVDEVRDSHGQFMYKLRQGNYANPAQARTDAKLWSGKLGIEVIITNFDK